MELAQINCIFWVKLKLGGTAPHVDDVLTYAMFPQIALKFFETRNKGPISFEEPKEQAKPPVSPSNSKAVYIVNVDNKDYRVIVKEEGIVNITPTASAPEIVSKVAPGNGVKIEAPVSGIILRLLKNNGDTVTNDETVIVMESMKMELEIKTKSAGRITYLVASGASVEAGQALANID